MVSATPTLHNAWTHSDPALDSMRMVLRWAWVVASLLRAGSDPVDAYDDEPPVYEAPESPATETRSEAPVSDGRPSDPATPAPASPEEASALSEPKFPGERRVAGEGGRRGGFLSLSGGISNCGVGCSDVSMGGLARFEAGFRWPHVALGASVSLGGADLGSSDDLIGFEGLPAQSSLRYAYFGPFAQFHFVASGPIDPYIAFGLGYHRLTRAHDVADGPETIDVNTWDEAAGVRIGGGVPLFLGKRVSLGPRFDYVFPIGGRLCQTVDGRSEEGGACTSWSDGLDGLDGETRRTLRRIRPQPWSLTLEIRAQF